MSFNQKLIETAEKNKSILCLGIDPVLEEIPLKEQSPEKKILDFYAKIIDATHNNISAVKPNYAYFAQYGFAGLRALKKIIAYSKNKKLIVILDAKRGDIGKSSFAYAREAFEFWKADAVTVSPYMGTDSVQPFLDYAKKEKGAYVLCRTSNPGALDFQDKIAVDVAKKIAEWKCGAVVGATNMPELRKISEILNGAPMLIPGVGSQGGNARETAEALNEKGDLRMHRINSSSGIALAYKIHGGEFAEAALNEVIKLNRDIGL